MIKMILRVFLYVQTALREALRGEKKCPDILPKITGHFLQNHGTFLLKPRDIFIETSGHFY